MAKSTHRHHVNGKERKPATELHDQKKPLTILARHDATSLGPKPMEEPAPSRPPPNSHQLFNAEGPQKQYKILQRPTRTPEVVPSPPSAHIEPPASPPVLQTPVKSAVASMQPNFDRRGSQPTSQQQTLLSLFGKPAAKPSQTENVPVSAISTPSAPGASPHSAIISPIVDKAPHKIDTDFGTDPTRSRLGSLSSMMGGGSHTPSSAKPTSASDKAFLSDFLASATLNRR